MSNADAERRAEVARGASRTRWVEREGNPVLARSVQNVADRRDELSDAQRAVLAGVIWGKDGDDAA